MSGAPEWSAYWRVASGNGCLPGAPEAVARMLHDGWAGFANGLPRDARLLDLACGSGAVLEAVASARDDLTLTGVDAAEIPDAARGYRLLSGIDCGALPFENAGFEAVTSQFGIEYCPPLALSEAARVLAPGGALRFVVHAAGSAVIRHNAARRDAMRAIADAGLFDAALRSAAGLPVDPATGGRVTAARTAHAAQSIADELPRAIAQALGRPGAPDGVRLIVSKAKAEIARLDAMTKAACDGAAIRRMAEALRALGIEAEVSEASPSAGPAIAWVIEGRKTF